MRAARNKKTNETGIVSAIYPPPRQLTPYHTERRKIMREVKKLDILVVIAEWEVGRNSE
jgi:hypothetical protein